VASATNLAVRDFVWTGWSMFHPFDREEIRPRVVSEPTADGEILGAQTNLLIGRLGEATLPDFWRLRVDGLGTIFRAYREDKPGRQDVSPGRFRPGTWLRPWNLVRDIYEFLAFATLYGRAFESTTLIEVRGTWHGLKGRRIDDPHVDWRPRYSDIDVRTATLEFPAAGAIERLHELTASLANQVLGLFDGFELSAGWVAQTAPTFRTLPKELG
jgi:hypothetical protein